ncbi:hypothetical protein AB6N01_03220 [Alcaligenes nematophilus]
MVQSGLNHNSTVTQTGNFNNAYVNQH